MTDSVKCVLSIGLNTMGTRYYRNVNNETMFLSVWVKILFALDETCVYCDLNFNETIAVIG